jgi:hypothetical protein
MQGVGGATGAARGAAGAAEPTRGAAGVTGATRGMKPGGTTGVTQRGAVEAAPVGVASSELGTISRVVRLILQGGVCLWVEPHEPPLKVKKNPDC